MVLFQLKNQDNMNPFDGYQVPDGFFSEQGLFQNKRNQLFRGVDKKTNTPVTLKKARPDGIGIHEVSKLSHEYNVLKTLDHQGIIKANELITSGKMMTLVLEWFEGETLKERMIRAPLSMELFFDVAVQLCGVLQYLHQSNIIHRDINPANILISADDKIKVIDFGISTVLQAEQNDAVTPDLIEGTLGYMAPEQTGRTSYTVTNSCDLYSLGIVLYEMLAGKLPFDSADPLEIIHFHLSRKPLWLQKINKLLPYGICAVVQKLLEKSPDDRYQSAGGVLADLHVLADAYHKHLKTDGFIAGQTFGNERFKQVQKLYGREKETAELNRYYDELEQTKSALVLISGYSGVGKSALVKQIQQPIVEKRGLFITGKFDQFKQNIPYFSFIEAFRELIKTLLSESEDSINYWRQHLTQVLGDNGGLITEVIPYLEMIIGKQPQVAKLQAAEQEFRFRMVMLDFIYAFTSPGRPMVIFLDDLQWSDLPSLNLLERILITPGNGNVLILGTYRDNEVTDMHPLRVTIRQLAASSVPMRDIKLYPLNEATTTRITADSFGMSSEDALELGRLVYRKTDGNPFFINRFLKSLYLDGYIRYNTSRRWEWDAGIIDGLEYTDNVIDLMTREMASLPHVTRDTMKMAAVLGNTFNIGHLSLITAKPQHEVFAVLGPAFKAGYILPLDRNYRTFSLSQEGVGREWAEESEKVSSNFRFLHDRVQQSAYTLIAAAERDTVHLHTGRILLANTAEDKISETVFEIIGHFTDCIYLITEESEKRRLGGLFLLAGLKAKDSTSYDLAVMYLSNALKLKTASCWADDYELTFNIYIELGACEYLNSNHEKASHYFDELLQYARTDFEKLKIYYVQSSLYIKLSKTAEALKIGRTAMKLYNINFPEHPTAIKLATMVQLAKYLFLFSTKYKKPESLYNLKECDDPTTIAINQFLIDIATSAYQENQELMMLVCFRIIQQYLKYGFTDASGWGFSGFSVVALSALRLSRRGFGLWDITTRLHDRTQSQLIKWKLRYTVSAFSTHWRSPIGENLDGVLDNIKGCLMNGDPIFSGYCIALYVWKKSASGHPIQGVLDLTKEQIEYLKRNKNISGLDFNVPRIQALKALAGMTPVFGDWDEPGFSGQQSLERIRVTGNNTILAYYYCARLPLLFFFGKYRELIDWSMEGSKYKPNIVGLYLVAEWEFYSSMAIVAYYPKFTNEERKVMMKVFKESMRWMKTWAHDCPENFDCQYKLLRAEEMAIAGQFEAALRLFDESIKSASENGFTHIEAIANERAAIFLQAQGHEKIGRPYLKSAWDLFHTWGAHAVCKHLVQSYPNYLRHAGGGFDQQVGTTDGGSTTGTTRVVLDLGSIMKASQNLASQVKLEELLQSLMYIVIENAGAQKGYLLLERNGVLCVEAEGNSGPKGNTILPSVPFLGSGLLPESLIQYCWRVEEPVVIANAMTDEKYYAEPYVTKNKVLSMLCLPISEKGRKTGLLYLENTLLEGVFTRDRLELLMMLSGQIGISIQNAMLYENLEEKVRERTLEITKQQGVIEEEMRKSDSLLLNILPEKTAMDLKAKGFSKAISYPNTTVMFCDIEGFTKRVEKMQAEELVDEIHELFSGFDDIVYKHRIEKIKTIGDAYLCASGLDESDDELSAIKAVVAAREILAYLDKLNARKVKAGKEPFRLRIGIHSGPVIAGVVGKSKFAYDIWGDTVNTAARMQTAGEAGKINISHQTFVQVKNHFICKSRGMMEAKNKGLIEMFFVEE
jgi:predicted ATPase/class 3 adenylate cyclase